MNYYHYIILLFIIIIKSKQSDDNDFLDLKSKNNSICDLKISTDNIVVFDKCILSDEWKLYYEKTTSQNVLEVYENKETKRRIFNLDYIIDNHKNQQDLIIKNITIKTYYNKKFINIINISISHKFPIVIKKGDNFDVIIEYENDNLLYINLVLTIYMQYNANSKIYDLKFGYKKILSNEFKKKINLSYLFLIIFFIFFIFLIRLRFSVSENQFIKIHINEIMQGKNAEKIFVVVGILLTILLFFMIIKYIYYITFIFSILLSIISLKSFFKYLSKTIFPSFTELLDDKFLEIQNYKVEYSNIAFYPISILVIIFWYNLSDENIFDLHTFLNDIIFFTIVYFNVHILNLKNFYIITGISFIVIIYQVIKIVLDEDIIQEDTNNIFYITTRFIIDVPIRFILKDFVDSPFEEIYFFSILDVILIGFIIHYCENTYHLSKIYLMISIYGTIIGLIINLFIFYSIKFSPPMSTIPLFINIISLIGYSVYQKQFLDFMDIEQNNDNVNAEFKEIEEIQEDQNAQIEFFKNDNNNISFSNDKLFEEEKDLLKIKEGEKEENEDDDSDEEERKKHENIINKFNRKLSSTKFNINNHVNSSNKINRFSVQDDSENEGLEKFIDLVGGMTDNKNESPEERKLNSLKNKNNSNKNIKKLGQKMVEMKVFKEDKEKEINKEK